MAPLIAAAAEAVGSSEVLATVGHAVLGATTTHVVKTALGSEKTSASRQHAPRAHAEVQKHRS